MVPPNAANQKLKIIIGLGDYKFMACLNNMFNSRLPWKNSQTLSQNKQQKEVWDLTQGKSTGLAHGRPRFNPQDLWWEKEDTAYYKWFTNY